MGAITQSTIRTSFVLGMRLLIQAGTLLLVARLLGPDQFGLFAGVAALAVLMGTFSTFGTHLVLFKEASKDFSKYKHVLKYAVPTTLIVGSLLFILYILICFIFFSQFNPSLALIICIGITEIILLPLFGLSTIEELALGKTAKSQLLTIFPLGLRTIAVLVVLFASSSNSLALLAWLYFITALLAIISRKIFKPNAWLKAREWRLANFQELKNSSSYAVLALSSAGPSELDKMLAVKLLPLGMSGIYIASARVVGAITLPITALLLSALPRLFRNSSDSTQKSSGFNRLIISCGFIYGIFIAVLVWIFSSNIEWLFGSKYIGMAIILKWLSFVIPVLVLRIILVNILMTMEKPWIRAIIEFLGAFIFATSAIIFYVHYGVLGIVLALIISEWSMVLMAAYSSRKV